ncbi:hypothetical protein [Desulfurella sp.]|uniref:hypothetical protein n=1 Tax=Desulfurella sp. TaxID=1962857 RepID=UPI0025C16155|nr:hypothetical protein [Desulfurella sp.]
MAQSESQFDFNHKIPIFIENRINDIVQESPSSVELNENSKKPLYTLKCIRKTS